MGKGLAGGCESEIARSFPLDWYFHAFGYFHPAGSALAESMAIHKPIDSRANAVHALVDVDARFDGFFSEIGALRNFNFFVLFCELDNWHVFDRNRERNLRKNLERAGAPPSPIIAM